MSNELEDALFEERKEINRILWQLTKMVLDEAERILDSVKMLALIDLTYAKARFSIDYDMTAPRGAIGYGAAFASGPSSAAPAMGRPAERLPGCRTDR